MYETFEVTPFKRNYDAAFGHFRFTLCMQEFFDSIPQEQWKINDPVFIRQSEEFAITKFKDWIIEQIT